MAMYEGFKPARIQTSDPEVQINLRYGGSGPPVLLLHGYPLTLAHRHLVGLTSRASTPGVGRHESSRQSSPRRVQVTKAQPASLPVAGEGAPAYPPD